MATQPIRMIEFVRLTVKQEPSRAVGQARRNVVSNRNREVLMERVAGSTLQAIGDRHDLTAEGVRVVFAREARKQIDDLELRLLANTKTDDLELFLIPDHGGPDFDLALAYLRWALGELAERGVKTRVHYRPTHNGVVIGVEDVTPYGKDKR